MILCCGEALIDMIPAPVANGDFGFVPHAGGAIFNTAIALGRLQIDTGFLTGLSTDLFGDQLAGALKDSGVDTQFAIRSDLPTTLAFVKLTDGHAQYTFYDENTAGRSLLPEDVPHLPETVDALYFGGISLISEPCADFYAALARTNADARVVMLDPNIRPSFIRQETRYRARLNDMMSLSDILKVSDEDLDWIVGSDKPLEDQAATLMELGPQILIVTRGKEGASAFLKDGTVVHAPAQSVTVVDTVGAGDTFNAGVLAHLSDKGALTKAALGQVLPEDVKGALVHGASIAAITVSRAGANPPWAHELDKDGSPKDP